MGCFFACFRFKADDPRGSNLVPPPSSSKCREHFVSKNQLASVFLCEENASPCKSDSGREGADRELKHEAKFLKACGALSETPAEIRKASQKLCVQTHEEHCLPPKSHSLPPDTACKKLQWDEQTDQALISTLLVNDFSDFSECKHGSNTSEKLQAGSKQSSTLSLLMSEPQNADPQCKIKSINFEGLKNNNGNESVPESGVLDISTPHIGHKSHLLGSNQSPCPTPLKLTDEMQTPGTIYPGNLDSLGTMKNARIRSQYVYPVSNSIGKLSDTKTLRDDPCEHGKLGGLFDQHTKDDSTNEFKQSSEELQLPNPSSPNEKQVSNSQAVSNEKSYSYGTPTNELKRENFGVPHQNPAPTIPSLSQWLKPPLPVNERRIKETSPSGKSSSGDRPIIGIVAAHWNDDEQSRISPKWWDGNGIPNSTNKYKEDQRVSWHATPFEERLEKALSDENQFPGRNLKARPIEFEDEECDTAAS